MHKFVISKADYWYVFAKLEKTGKTKTMLVYISTCDDS